VTATIKPLSREKTDEQAAVKEHVSSKTMPPPEAQSARVPSKTLRTRLGMTLDGSWDRKLASGAVQPDRIVDLHGMSLDSAWRAIDHALERAIDAGERVVLLITGHHRPGAPPVERGKIRRRFTTGSPPRGTRRKAPPFAVRTGVMAGAAASTWSSVAADLFLTPLG
jgi:DNA-nicking Smr family endonuclease